MKPARSRSDAQRRRGWGYLIFGKVAMCILTVLYSPASISETNVIRDCARAIERAVSGEYRWTASQAGEVFPSMDTAGDLSIRLSGSQMLVDVGSDVWVQVEYFCWYETQSDLSSGLKRGR